VIQRLPPELHSVASASVIWAHDEEPDKPVRGVVANACDASDRIIIKASGPNPLPIGLAVNADVSCSWCKPLATRPVVDQGNIDWLDRANREFSSHPSNLKPTA
jgi:hypothetical protein